MATDSAAAGTSPFLRAFYELVSLDAEERNTGLTGLLDHLTRATKAGSGADDVDYTVKRLIRGLCSSRASARQGFAAALVRVLAMFPSATPLEGVVQQIMQATTPSGRQRGHEDRDQYFGRAFGFMAVQRSGRLSETSRDASDASFTIITELVKLMSAKRWLGDLSCECALAVCAQVTPNTMATRLAPQLLKLVPEDAVSCAPEHLQLAVGLLRVCTPHMRAWRKEAKAARKSSSTSAPHSALLERLTQFAQLLTPEGLHVVLPNLITATRTFPLVHSVWLHIASALLGVDLTPVSTPTAGEGAAAVPVKSKGASFAKFWEVAVEQGLMNSTHERRATALVLLQAVVRSSAMTADLVPVLLSRRVFGCLRNNMGAKDNYLQQPARAAVRTLHEVAASNQGLAAALLSAFLAQGGPHFDARTHTRTVATLQECLDADALAAHAALLRATFIDPNAASSALGTAGSEATEGADEATVARSAMAKRVWALDGISACCRSSRIEPDSELVATNMAFLTRHSFFEAEGGEDGTQVEVDQATRAEVNARLHTVLDHVATVKASKGTSADYVTALRRVHQVYDDLSESLTPVIPLSSTATSVRKEALAAVDTLRAAAAAVVASVGDDDEAGAAAVAADSVSRQLTGFAALLGLVSLLQLGEEAAAGGGDESEDEDMGNADGSVDVDAADPTTGLLWDLVRCGFDLCRTDMVAAAAAAGGATGSTKARRSKRKGKSKSKGKEVPTTLGAAWDPEAWAQVGEAAGADAEEGATALSTAVPVFADACLALLARPSKLVRNLVKYTFRQFAHMLTPEAISTMLRAVFKPTKGDGADGSDDEGESGSDSDVEVEGAGKEGLSSEKTAELTMLQDAMNSAEGDVGDLQALLGGAATKPRRKTRGQQESKGKPAGDDDEDGSGSDSGSDSDGESVPTEGAAEMMDAMLVNMIKLRQERKGRAKSLREQALHFKYRVLDLVEAAVTKLAGHPLLLEFPLPMLRSVRTCIQRIQQDRGAREATGLLNRVQAILSSRVCKGKVPHATTDGSSGVTPDHVHELLEQTLELAVRGGGTQFVALASNVAWLLLRSLRAGGSMAERAGLLDEERVAAVYGNVATHYMTANNPKVNFKLFIDLVRRAPFLAWRLAPIMCTAAGGDSTKSPFRRREAFDFLVALTRQSSSGGATAAALVPDMFTAVTRTFNEVAAQLGAKATPTLSAKRLRSAFQLGSMLLSAHRNSPSAKQLIAAATALQEATTTSSIVAGCKRCLAAARQGQGKKGKKGKKDKQAKKGKGGGKRQRTGESADKQATGASTDGAAAPRPTKQQRSAPSAGAGAGAGAGAPEGKKSKAGSGGKKAKGKRRAKGKSA